MKTEITVQKTENNIIPIILDGNTYYYKKGDDFIYYDKEGKRRCLDCILTYPEMLQLNLIREKNNILPYVTKNGHEFFIKWENKVAHVTCHNDGQITDNLKVEDIDYMMQTAMILGTESMVLNTDYGIDIHTHTLKTNAKYKNFKLNKLVTQW